MSNYLHMNNFTASWRHFKRNINTYESDDGIVEFRYEDVNGGDNINYVINYIETTNMNALHELLRTMIDDLPNDPYDPWYGTIVVKNYHARYYDFQLDRFLYQNFTFQVIGQDCVMIRNPPAEE